MNCYTMLWQKSVTQAEKWEKSSRFCVREVNESERKIVFRSKASDNVTFWVTIPDEKDIPWAIWSDVEKVQHSLDAVLDLVSSGRALNVVDILEKAESSLVWILKKGNNEDGDKMKEEVDDEDDDNEDEDDDDGDMEDDYNYYGYEEEEATDTTPYKEMNNLYDEANKYQKGPNQAATFRLVKDMKMINGSEGKFGVSGGPRGDNLFLWDVELNDFPKDSLLGKDLERYAKQFNEKPVVSMEIKFPDEYPLEPPFVRVTKPRFQFMTGHVTLGGSVCMQMLTKSGWAPTFDIESVLVQVRSEIMSDPKAALDLKNGQKEYTEAEAKDAFKRMVAKYQW